MTKTGRVVWSEGMFLRTQHFQQQDRHIDGLVRAVIQAQARPVFGFSRLTLDQNALAAGLVAIDEAEGVFPDGLSFSVPDGAVDVTPVPVTSDTMTGHVLLAIPAESEGATLIDQAHDEPSGARMRGVHAEIRDAVRRGGDPEAIEIARLAPQLLLPGQSSAGYLTLPVARLRGRDADGAVVLDDGFLPPALVTSAVPWFQRFAKEVESGLEHIAEVHSSIVLGGTGASVENLLILDLANAALARVSHLAAQNDYHPSEFFLELAGLAGRMATYASSSRRMAELPVYEHTNPQPAFAALADTLRSFILSLRHREEKARTLKVSRHSENVWTVRIDSPDIIRKSRIVVRVGGDMSEALLRTLFVDQATVGSAEQFDKLWTSRLPGIPLKPLHSQPREIPYDGDRLCLELDRTSEHWGELADSPGFVLGVTGKLEREPEIDCYAISR